MVWFEKQGWKEDPLEWSRPSDFLIGLEDQTKQLQDLASRKKLIILHGPTGTGKTTLAKNAIELNKSYHTIYLRGDLLLGEPNKNISKEVNKLKYLLFKKPIVMIVDEARSTPVQILEQIKGLFDVNKLRSVVFLQITEDLSNYPDALRGRLQSPLTTVETKILSKEQLYELLNKRLDGKLEKLFEKEAAMALIRLGGGVPRVVMGLCSDMLASSKGKVTLKDIEVLTRKGDLKPVTSDDKPYVTSTTSRLSPDQEKLCSFLATKPRTYDELEKLLNKPVRTISTQISRLVKSNKVIKINSKPVKFDLEPGFKFQRITDME